MVWKLIFAVVFSLCFLPLAKAADYPSNRGDLIGPSFRTDANAAGFVVQGVEPLAGVSPVEHCAPRNSSLIVTKRSETETWVKFHGLGVPNEPAEIAAYKLICGDDSRRVVYDVIYKISNTKFDAIPLRSSGIAYGALVVPFKFRLGSDKKIASSATIAPYIGVRWHRLQKWGVELMPIATAGLALVPVNDPDTNESSTKAAFSTAIGVTLNSTTQKNFSAGILFGRDFLGKKDRGLDPSVNKPWISIWVGTAQ